MRCWCGYLSGTRYRLFAYGSADATASPNPSFLALFKSVLVLPFWYRLTQVVMEKRPLNGSSSSSSSRPGSNLQPLPVKVQSLGSNEWNI